MAQLDKTTKIRFQNFVENVNSISESSLDLNVQFIDPVNIKVDVLVGVSSGTLEVDLGRVCKDQYKGCNLVADYLLGRIANLVAVLMKNPNSDIQEMLTNIGVSVKKVIESLVDKSNSNS